MEDSGLGSMLNIAGDGVGRPSRVRLLGRWDLTLDVKGRLSVSPVLRRELGDAVVLYCSLGRKCLEIIPVETFYSLMEQLYAQGGREAVTCISGNSLETVFDSHGRVQIPVSFRGVLGLSGDVLLTGDFDRVCVWSPEAWDAYNRKTLAVGSNADVIAKLGL